MCISFEYLNNVCLNLHSSTKFLHKWTFLYVVILWMALGILAEWVASILEVVSYIEYYIYIQAHLISYGCIKEVTLTFRQSCGTNVISSNLCDYLLC